MQTLTQALAQAMKNGVSHTTSTAVQSSEKAERAKKHRAALERLKDELQCDEIISQSWREPREGIDCPVCNNNEIINLIPDGKMYARNCSCVKARDSIK